MNILIPLAITDAMVSSSTIAEPAAGEVVWNAATSYAVGDRVILTSTHRVYENLIAGVNATSPDQTLTSVTPRWYDYGPTNKFAAFDNMVNTPSSIVTPLTFVLRPGFFNALGFYGLDGANIDISIKEAPGGAVFLSHTSELQEPPPDMYEWLFAPIKPLTKLVLQDIVPYPDPEVTITITAPAGTTVKVGMIVMGDMRPLAGVSGKFGGTEFGAVAKPVSYSYINTDKFGRTIIKRRHKATDMRATVALPKDEADYALTSVQEVLDVPCGWVATKVPGYAGLNVFGLGEGELTYDSAGRATFNLTVKGTI